MSEFEVGEVVVYTGPTGRKDIAGHSGIPLGSYHRVLGVKLYPQGQALRVKCRERFVWATSFRKLPRADADFTATIRACRPVKAGEVA